MNTLTTTLSILLAVSMAGNAFFGRGYLSQRDKATTAKVETVQVAVVAAECSKGTENLATAADQRRQAAAPKIAAAKKEAREADKRADVILATPPAAPGDDCKSAEARVDTWWQGRAKP